MTFIYVFFVQIAHLHKGGLLFSWTNYARWLQHLRLWQVRDPCELGWWEEPTSKGSLTVPAPAQYFATGAYRLQHKKHAFSSWPRTGSSLRGTCRQHGILWEDLPDCHSKPKFQQKMSRVQSLQRCDLLCRDKRLNGTSLVWKPSLDEYTELANLGQDTDQVSQRSILTPGCMGRYTNQASK